MKDEPGDLTDLYSEFGRTAEMAQVMEVDAGNLALAFSAVGVDPNNVSEEQKSFYRALVDDVNKRTFGNLLKQIRRVADVSDSIVETVDTALEKRNYLTHRFFRTHNFAIHSEEGRVAMRAELGEIYKALSLAHTVLCGMTATEDCSGASGGRDASRYVAKAAPARRLRTDAGTVGSCDKSEKPALCFNPHEKQEIPIRLPKTRR